MTKKITAANRVGRIQEYYFSRKLREVAQMRADGIDVISLAIGGPDRPPMPEVIETLSRLVSPSLRRQSGP